MAETHSEIPGIPPTVGEEVTLAQMLTSRDVEPLLAALVGDGAGSAVIAGSEGKMLWSFGAASEDLLEAARRSAAESGHICGADWCAEVLSHEGEPVGIFCLRLVGRGSGVHRLATVGTAALKALIWSSARRLATSNVHNAVISVSHEELVATNKRLAASEERYRLLSENLQQQVDARTAELEKALTRLVQHEKLSAIGQLAAGMAHEINTPLGFIISNLNTLRRYLDNLLTMMGEVRPELSRSACEALQGRWSRLRIDHILADVPALLEESAQGATRIHRIVSDLKDFSHIDDAARCPVDVGAEVDRVLAVLAAAIRERGVTVTRDCPPVPPVMGRPADLGLALLNIITNAIESGDNGPLVTISTQTDETSVTVSVSDTGRGIPAEDLGRVFEPFFTTKQVGAGTGLGMTVTYQIVKAHGGTVDIESTPGHGTTVRLVFPLRN